MTQNKVFYIFQSSSAPHDAMCRGYAAAKFRGGNFTSYDSENWRVRDRATPDSSIFRRGESRIPIAAVAAVAVRLRYRKYFRRIRRNTRVYVFSVMICKSSQCLPSPILLLLSFRWRDGKQYFLVPNHRRVTNRTRKYFFTFFCVQKKYFGVKYFFSTTDDTKIHKFFCEFLSLHRRF